MLGAANRDPTVFEDPDSFDIDRLNLRCHIGFAIGSHHCLGSHLAKLEASIAVRTLLERLPNFRVDPKLPVQIRGYEFRQPTSMPLLWA